MSSPPPLIPDDDESVCQQEAEDIFPDDGYSEENSFEVPLDPVAAIVDVLTTEEGEPVVDVLSGIREVLAGMHDVFADIKHELHIMNKILNKPKA